MKTCTRCETLKPVDAFGKRTRSPDGLTSACAECLREDQRRRRKEKPEQFAATAKAWRAANPDKVRAKKRSYHERNAERVNEKTRLWRLENAEHVKSFDLQRNYGITLDDYAALLAHQGGRCAGCATEECATGRNLCVDHNHEHRSPERGCPDCIRGLLCARCNFNDVLAGHPAVDWKEVLSANYAAA